MLMVLRAENPDLSKILSAEKSEMLMVLRAENPDLLNVLSAENPEMSNVLSFQPRVGWEAVL